MNTIARLKDCAYIFFTCFKSGMYGMHAWYKVSQSTGSIVTILGGHRAPPQSYFTELAYEMAHQCVLRGKAVLTGGGSGVMEAANCGAFEKENNKGYAHIHTFGIGIHGIDGDYHNPCSPIVYVNTFFIRKWLFVTYSSAFIFLPGGIGTVDELFDVLNMIDTQQITSVPVILIDSDYWRSLTNWIKEAALEHNLINPLWLTRFSVVNTVAEAMVIIDAMSTTKK